MLRKLILPVAMLAAIFACSANAQNWKFTKVFPDSTFANPAGTGINNAVTVDGTGRVWIGSSGTVDSLPQTGGTYLHVGAVWVFNPDGSQASFSPIEVFKGSWATGSDSVSSGTAYGLETGPDGNIYVEKPSSYIYELSYKDGSGLAKAVYPIPGYSSSLADLAIDAAGEVFLVPVIGGPGPVALSADLSSVIATIDTSAYGGVARSIGVTADGNDVFVPYFAGIPAGPVVFHYHSDNGTLGTYAFADTLFKGMSVESMAWDPKTGYFWCGSGGPTRDPSLPPWSPLTWYAFDMTTPSAPVLKDSLTWAGPSTGEFGDIDERGIAFSPTGDTVYVSVFAGGGGDTTGVSHYNDVEMFVNTTGTAVKTNPQVALSYSLSQNYPNPFNPTTKIDYTLKSNVKVTLKVYDVLGREVATLVDGVQQSAGQHYATFNGNDLASGVYMYSLTTSDGFKMVKKMVLMK
ncbi:MAG: T9SS type A sorting domain-containing protein [Candidatus Kryptoniota bacterium]